ncbi:MAG: hypothetical protein AVDCRST_MAG89-1704, partial [uncultured Gemmatimonadetes bacterium]
ALAAPLIPHDLVPPAPPAEPSKAPLACVG